MESIIISIVMFLAGYVVAYFIDGRRIRQGPDTALKTDGPLERGWVSTTPSSVLGGYQPTSDSGVRIPPQGGTGVRKVP